MYRLRRDLITKSIRLHSVECQCRPAMTQSRDVLWSEVCDEKGDAVEEALHVLIKHLECRVCLGGHRCTEDVFSRD